MLRKFGLIISLGLMAGCASTQPPSIPRVDDYAREVGESRLNWQKSMVRDEQTSRLMDSLLKSPLTTSQAVQIALVNNRGLQEKYQSLGLAQGHLVQAGLLRNPSLSGTLKKGLEGIGSGFEIGIAQQIVSLFYLPRLKKLAAMEVEIAKHSMVSSVAELIEQTQIAYVEYQASIRIADLIGQKNETRRLAAEMAKRQSDAGNISTLELASFQASYEAARLDGMTAAAHLVASREKLVTLMGLWENVESISLQDSIASVPRDTIDVNALETMAIQQRADLKAAESEIVKRGRQAGIEKASALIPEFTVGVNYEKEISGEKNISPNLSIEIPVFDRGVAVSAVNKARIRASQEHYSQLAVKIRSDVRAGIAKVEAARTKVLHIQDILLPLRSKITNESQLLFNGMYIGVFDLLNAKSEELDTQKQLIEALEEFWTARAQLVRVVGSPLPVVGR